MPKNNRTAPKTSDLTTFGSPPPAVLHNRLIDTARGTHRVVIYSAGSRGLANFIRPLGLTAFKLGVTSAGDAQRRVVDLRRKAYGSLFGRPDAPIEAMVTIEQADEWALVPLKLEHLGGNQQLPPGFHFRHGVLEVEVRIDVPVEAVDQSVHRMMALRSLDTFLGSEIGKAKLEAAGRDPEGILMTPYSLMFEELRISRVTELYLFRPQVELRRLVDCLATVLAPLMPAGNQAAEAA
jgi:hypothetical protein